MNLPFPVLIGPLRSATLCNFYLVHILLEYFFFNFKSAKGLQLLNDKVHGCAAVDLSECV